MAFVGIVLGTAAAGLYILIRESDKKRERERRERERLERETRERERRTKFRRNQIPKQQPLKEPKRVQRSKPVQKPKKVKPAKDVIEMKENENDHYHLENMLVVIICVGKYDDGVLADLPGTQKDLKNLVSLFRDKYKYKSFHTTKPRVTYNDMDILLTKARLEFMENEYDGVIVCFSGHGQENVLLCSDYDGHGKGIFSRQDFHQWFDGNNCKSRIDKYKFYFLDACRGNQDASPIKQEVNIGTRSRANMASSSLKNASENTCYMYGNSNWSVTLETKAGGMLTSAVVDAFETNLTESMAIGPLQSKIRKIAKEYGNNRDGVILPPVENTIDHEIMGKITFGPKIDEVHAQKRGFTQNIKTAGLSSDYVRMFNTIKWKRKMTENDRFGKDDPYYHLLLAVKHQTNNRPSRIRDRDSFINILKKETRFYIIDGYDILGNNFYEAYKTFIDANLKSDNAFNDFNYWRNDYNSYLDLPDIE